MIQLSQDRDHQDVDGHTALMIAARQGQIEIVKLLLAFHASVDLQNNAGNTALMLAIKNGKVESAMALIISGANLELNNTKGETPKL